MKVFRQSVAIVLVFLVCNMYLFPVAAMAKVKNKTDHTIEIKAPQSRLSPEIIMLTEKGSDRAGWIEKHKWWVLIGLAVIAGGAVFSSDSGGSDGNSDDDNNVGFGTISGKW